MSELSISKEAESAEIIARECLEYLHWYHISGSQKQDTEAEEFTGLLSRLDDAICNARFTNDSNLNRHFISTDSKRFSRMTQQEKDSLVATYMSQIAKMRQTGKSQSERNSLFPIKDKLAYLFTKKQQAAHWDSNEADFSRDKVDWYKITTPQKHLFSGVFGTFAGADTAITNNIVFRFLVDAETPEEMSFYATQMANEIVHMETYNLTIVEIVTDKVERERILTMSDHNHAIRNIHEFMDKYTQGNYHRSVRLFAFACAEGIFFPAPFAVIGWYKDKGLFHNVNFMNEQIGKDELQIHRMYACLKIRQDYLDYFRDNYKMFVDIAEEAVAIEDEWVDEFLPRSIEDMTNSGMKEFTRFMADDLFEIITGEKHFKDRNPFPWMDNFCSQVKSNFYEMGVGNYKKGNPDKIAERMFALGHEESEEEEFEETDPKELEELDALIDQLDSDEEWDPLDSGI